jgi:hypothetical protein
MTHQEAIEELKKINNNNLILNEKSKIAIDRAIVVMKDYPETLIAAKSYWEDKPCCCTYEGEEASQCFRCFKIEYINQILQEVTRNE